MRKGMKAFAAVLAVATASTMSLTAFADVTVTTKYEDSKVKSEVTGVASGDMVAYVVYDTNLGIEGTNSIKFIDQQTANGEKVTFEFPAEKAAIWSTTGHTVKVGTSKAANNANMTNELKTEKGKVTYKVGENGSVLAYTDTAGETFAEGDSHEIESASSVSFQVFPNPGYKLKEIKKDDTVDSATATDAGVYTYTITQDTKFEFSFEKISGGAVSVPKTSDSVDNTLTTDSSNKKAKTFTYAKVDSEFAYDEIGFVISSKQDKIDSTTTTKVEGDDVKYFAAYGIGSDGAFAIEVSESLKDDETDADAAWNNRFLKDTMYAWSYVKSGGTYTYGSMITLGGTN